MPMRVRQAGTNLGLVLLFLLGNIIYSIAPALAATPNQGLSLQISPLPISLSTKPGTSTSADLRVRNGGSEDEKLQIHLLKVTEDNNGNVHLTVPTSSDYWTKWVSFSQSTFDAPAGLWQTIKMTVNVPKNAAFGYYFAVEYTRADQEPLQPGKTVTHGAVATFILLDVEAPGAVRSAKITSFTADHKSYEFLPATFTVKIKATGNINVAPHGNIFIMKGGKQVGSIQINSAEGNVLPGGSRYFSASWNDGFPVYIAKYNGDQPVVDKNGKPVMKLSWNFSHLSKLRFGHYTANLVMVYNNGSFDAPLNASVGFWVIPWRIIGGLLLVLVLIGAGIWSLFRRSSRLVRRGGRRSYRA